MKFTTASGKELDDETMWISPSEIENAVAEWNAPAWHSPAPAPPSLPPIPPDELGWLIDILAGVNDQLATAHRRRVDVFQIWRLRCFGRDAASSVVVAALRSYLAILGVAKIAADARLKMLAQICAGMTAPGAAQ
jgi:hypothetical protein